MSSKAPAKPGKPGDKKNGQQVRRETHPVHLMTSELLARGEEFAALDKERAEIESEKSVATADFKARINKIDARVSFIAKALRDGTEPREVEVQDRELFATNEMVTRRLDTGEELSRRAMTVDERQAELPGT